jgi:predicted O-methyltransferase YrrM
MNTRVDQLLNTKRLDFKYKQSNTTKGLYDLITKYVTTETVMVELGSFAGVSSELFALHCKHLYCVDPWLPYWEITDEETIHGAEIKFDFMMKDYTNITKCKINSSEAATQFAPQSIDMVYIDSDHSSDNVEKEINLWVDKIKPHGFIAGHDFNLPTVFNVVTKHFDPTFIEIFNDTSWIVCIDKKIHDRVK